MPARAIPLPPKREKGDKSVSPTPAETLCQLPFWERIWGDRRKAAARRVGKRMHLSLIGAVY